MTAVGWLHGTVPRDAVGPNDVVTGWRLFGLLHELLPSTSRQLGQTMHYGKGVVADDGLWSVRWEGTGGAAGSVFAQIAQRGFEVLGLDRQVEGLRAVLGFGLVPRRLDLAGDAYGYGRMPRDYFESRAAAWTRTRRAAWTLHEKGDGGQTLEIGSRTSERFARVYVKGPDRVRHELELKGGLAEAACSRIAAGASPGAVWSDEYGRLVRWIQ